MKQQSGEGRSSINQELTRSGSGAGSNERISFAFYLAVLTVGLLFTFGGIVCVLKGQVVAGSWVCLANFGTVKYFYARLEAVNRHEREIATIERRLLMAFSEVEKITDDSARDQARRDVIDACIKVDFDPSLLRLSTA